MKKRNIVLAVATSLLAWMGPQAVNARAHATTGGSRSLGAYLGRWDLIVRTPTQERPSWIDISDDHGRIEGLMVGLWGHATPTGEIRIQGGEIEIAVPKDEGFPDGTRLLGRLARGGLVGAATAPNGASWPWAGHPAPALERKGVPKWGRPIRLFDGKDLAGWTFADPTQASAWSVEGGTLVKHGRGSEIVTTSRFRDFKLHIEFNCGPMANSGVYLRGRYEVQIETNAAQEPPNHRMGAIYGFIAPQPLLPSTPNVWQSYDITLVGRTVTVVDDGRTIIDHREIPGITGGALNTDEGSPGPIYLQGTEDGRVRFRNIVITPAE
ncbi:MAG: 3-keto-disaccharide hydrolase [Steroidobacteraceae bacterium]